MRHEYTYDARNKLIRVTIQSGQQVSVEEYRYDYAGNRIAKIGELSTTYYLVDRDGALSQVLAEYDENSSLTTLYTRGEELISQERDGQKSYYLYDSFDSVRMLADEDNNITDTYTFDAFGNLVSSTGDTENSYLYRGEQYDSFTGLYYLRARYMNPSTGTFITMDEYAGSIFEPVSLHKYLYANANPVTYCDPSGYFAVALVSGYGISLQIESQYNEMILSVGRSTLMSAMGLVALSAGAVIKNEFTRLSIQASIGNAVSAKDVIALLYENYASQLVLAQTYAETIKAVAKAMAKPLVKGLTYSDNSVYFLMQDDEVMYVGITNDPSRRAAEHAADDNKKYPDGRPWEMFVLVDGLSRPVARTMEQALICAFTIEALSNARYEIAEKNYDKFKDEMDRVASLLKVPNALKNMMIDARKDD